MSNHTPTPWRLSFPKGHTIGIRAEKDYLFVADGLSRDNAQRIIDCVNSFDGVENPAVALQETDDTVFGLRLKQIHLVSALKSALPLLESCAHTHLNGDKIYKQALDALAKAKGGTDV